MNENPCVKCDFGLQHEDKNNETCRECEKRVDYVMSLHGLECTKKQSEEKVMEDEHGKKVGPPYVAVEGEKVNQTKLFRARLPVHVWME